MNATKTLERVALAVHLDDYLCQSDAIQNPCFGDHRGCGIATVPARAELRA